MITAGARDKYFILQAFGYENGKIKIINLQDSSLSSSSSSKIDSFTLFEHVGEVSSLSFGTVNEVPHLASAGVDGKLIIWSYQNGIWENRTVFSSKVPLSSVSFSCNSSSSPSSSSLIAFADYDGKIQFINPENDFEVIQNYTFYVTKHQQNGPNITQVAFMPGKPGWLLVISSNGTLIIYEFENDFYVTKGENYKFAFSKSYVKNIATMNNFVAAVCFDSIVRVFDFRTCSLTEINPPLPDEVDSEITHFYNDNPICALYWREYQSCLVVCVQNSFQFEAEGGSVIDPKLSAVMHSYIQRPTGDWVRIDESKKTSNL